MSRRWGALPTKVVCVDADEVPAAIGGLDGYVFALVLVRVGVEPVGIVRVPVEGDRCPGRSIVEAIERDLGPSLVRVRLLAALEREPRSFASTDLAHVRPRTDVPPSGTVTVAVCTRDRPAQLDRCLAALASQVLPANVVVVDNAPVDDATARVVARYPGVERVVEPRPGLDHARNRAIAEASTDVLAFTDDDVVVDRHWTWAVARAFAEEPDLGVLTGLVVPLELETPAQQLFERLGGFGRGVTRRWVDVGDGDAGRFLGAGQFGTGANMAFRRATLARIGGFDPALDVGTPTGGGGDLEVFFRAIARGELLRYEPAAIVFHRHRRSIDELVNQVRGNGAVWSMMSAARLRGDAAPADVARVVRWYAGTFWPQRIAEAWLVPNRVPPSLPLAEVRGTLAAAVGRRYQRSQRVNGTVPATTTVPTPLDHDRTAVSTLDVAGPLEPPAEHRVGNLILVTHDGAALGRVAVAPSHRRMSARRLRELVVDRGGVQTLVDGLEIVRSWRPDRLPPCPTPPRSVSVVIATLDRPHELAACLATVVAQRSRHEVEVVVVDNNPASGLTPAVLDAFPSVRRVDQPRRGLAHARNAGIVAATGEIVVTTDDDVRVPPGWLDLLLAPFRRNDVMAVCGNVQPLELEGPTQMAFEEAGALSKGFTSFESRWQHPVHPWRAFAAWELGATANAAFRASVFTDPEIGLMDTALGPGTPTGVGEDSYLVYRIVRAGYTVVYEAGAYVWHRHRTTEAALERQVTSYYSGHVAHQLTTLQRDHDLRAVNRLARVGTYVAVTRGKSLFRRGPVTPELARAQLRGVLQGPRNYVRARRRVAAEAS